MASGASTKGLEQVFSGLWRANIGSTVHFHGPGMPFLESLGRMASGVKPTPWPTPCSRAPKTMKKKKKNGPKRLCWAPYERGGGAQIQKKKLRKIGRELACGVREPSPLFWGSRKQWYTSQVPTPCKTPYERRGGVGLGTLKGSTPLHPKPIALFSGGSHDRVPTTR